MATRRHTVQASSGADFEPKVNLQQEPALDGVSADEGGHVLSGQPDVKQAERKIKTVARLVLSGKVLHKAGWSIYADYDRDQIEVVTPSGKVRNSSVLHTSNAVRDFLANTWSKTAQHGEYDPSVNEQQEPAVKINESEGGDILGSDSQTDESLDGEFEIGKVHQNHPMSEQKGTSTGAEDPVKVSARLACNNCSYKKFAYLPTPTWVANPELWERCAQLLEVRGSVDYARLTNFYSEKCSQSKQATRRLADRDVPMNGWQCSACKTGLVTAQHAPPSKTLGPDSQTEANTAVFDEGVNKGDPHTSVPSHVTKDTNLGPDSQTNANTSVFDPILTKTSQGLKNLGDDKAPEFTKEDADELNSKKEARRQMVNAITWELRNAGYDTTSKMVRGTFEALGVRLASVDAFVRAFKKLHAAQKHHAAIHNTGFPLKKAQELIKGDSAMEPISFEPGGGNPSAGTEPPTHDSNEPEMEQQADGGSDYEGTIGGESEGVPEVTAGRQAQTETTCPACNGMPLNGECDECGGSGKVPSPNYNEDPMPSPEASRVGFHDRNLTSSSDPASRYKAARDNKPSKWAIQAALGSASTEHPMNSGRRVPRNEIQAALRGVAGMTFRQDITQEGLGRIASSDGTLSYTFKYEAALGAPGLRDIQAFVDACSEGKRVYQVLDVRPFVGTNTVHAKLIEANGTVPTDSEAVRLGREAIRQLLGKDLGQDPTGMGSDYEGTVLNHEGQFEEPDPDSETCDCGTECQPGKPCPGCGAPPVGPHSATPMQQPQIDQPVVANESGIGAISNVPSMKEDNSGGKTNTAAARVAAPNCECGHPKGAHRYSQTTDSDGCNLCVCGKYLAKKEASRQAGVDAKDIAWHVKCNPGCTLEDLYNVDNRTPRQEIDKAVADATTKGDIEQSGGGFKVTPMYDPGPQNAFVQGLVDSIGGKRRLQSARIHEGWGDKGEYKREVEAEAPEDVWKLHQSLNGKEVEWPGRGPSKPSIGEDANVPAAQGAVPLDPKEGPEGPEMPETEPTEMNADYMPQGLSAAGY